MLNDSRGVERASSAALSSPANMRSGRGAPVVGAEKRLSQNSDDGTPETEEARLDSLAVRLKHRVEANCSSTLALSSHFGRDSELTSVVLQVPRAAVGCPSNMGQAAFHPPRRAVPQILGLPPFF
eukprot:1527362-Rhodomonas_salina.3